MTLRATLTYHNSRARQQAQHNELEDEDNAASGNEGSCDESSVMGNSNAAVTAASEEDDEGVADSTFIKIRLTDAEVLMPSLRFHALPNEFKQNFHLLPKSGQSTGNPQVAAEYLLEETRQTFIGVDDWLRSRLCE